MKSVNEMKSEAVLTFLKDTKDGKYVEIDKNIVETPRIMTSRNEFLIDEDIPILFSITNKL